MNESVSEMIKTLHARLNDLQIAVDKYPQELTGYDKKLDKIDDQVYYIIVEIEKRTKALEEAEKLPKFNVVRGSASDESGKSALNETSIDTDGESNEASSANHSNSGPSADTAEEDAENATSSEAANEKRVLKGGIFNEDYELTPKAKETIGNAAQTFGSFLKDAKEVTSEFSGLKKDLNETLDFLPGKGKFRR